MLERGYEGYDAYARSKLAQVMFTFERDDIGGRYVDGLRESRADPLAYDAARRRLWDVSAELTSAPPLAR